MDGDAIESLVFAGGGTTVASDSFVPSTLETQFTSPSGMCVTPSGSIMVSDHCIRSIFSIEGGRTHLVTERDPEQEVVGGGAGTSGVEVEGSGVAGVGVGEAHDVGVAEAEAEGDDDHLPLPPPPPPPSSSSASSSNPSSNPPSSYNASSTNSSPLSIGNPFGMVCLDDGSLLVADMHDNTVKKMSMNGDQISVFAGTGRKGGENGRLMESSFDKPKCLCPTPNGDVLLTEVGSHRIRLLILDYGGLVINVAGQGLKGYQEGVADSALFSHPSGICCLKIDPSFTYLTIKRVENYVHSEEDLIAAEMASLEGPNSPRLLVSPLDDGDGGGVDAAGRGGGGEGGRGVEGVGVGGGPEKAEFEGAPAGFHNDDDDHDLVYQHEHHHYDLIIFVSDTQNHRIRTISNGFVLSLAGNGEPGIADGPCNLAQFDHPGNICMAYRSILVADNRNDRIRLIDLDSSLVSSVRGYNDGHSPSYHLLSSHDQHAPILRLERPTVMCMSEEGDLFVSCEFETHAEIHQLSRFVPPRGKSTFSPAYAQSSLTGAPLSTASATKDSFSQGNLEARSFSPPAPRRASEGGVLSPSKFTLHPYARDVEDFGRERSKSVDSGQRGAPLPSNADPQHANPWGLVSKLARMLSLDEETMLNRVDGMLDRMGLRQNKASDIQPFEPEFHDKTPSQSQDTTTTKKQQTDSTGKKSAESEIDADEVITF